MTGKRSAGRSKLGRPALEIVGGEWVGGRFPAPMFVTGEGPAYRPDVILWLDIGRDRVLASELVRPFEPNAAITECLARLLICAERERGRRPTTLRVPDVATAELVRAHVGRDIDVCVGETPEVDRVLERLASRAPIDKERSYLEGGATPEALAHLFAAASRLYRTSPWLAVGDDSRLLAAEAPGLGLRRGCVSIIGTLGESRGMLLFPSVDDFRGFAALDEVADGCGRGRRLGFTLVSLHFERGYELPASLRREIGKYGWEVADVRAYPWIRIIEPDYIERPAGTRDVLLVAALAEAVATFLRAERRLFEGAVPKVVTRTYRMDLLRPGLEITIRAPHPDAPWPVDARRGAGTGGDTLLDVELVVTQLVDAFVRDMRERGAPEPLAGAAEVIVRALYDFKLREEGHLAETSATLLERFLLEHVPAVVDADAALVDSMPSVLRAWVDWLERRGTLSPTRATTLRRRIDAVRARFVRYVADPARWSPVKRLLATMRLAAGIDLVGERTLRRLVIADRLDGHEVLRAAPGERLRGARRRDGLRPPDALCPCGSGRRYESCCMRR